ncbi:DUF2961 domain-containing protein [Aeoliella sp.]|uniref:DUF2961 domain-containing protein n=1 Tax=Aeoliella sp. TaxID=2795800 RepID=UPI003CCBFAD7
MSHRSILAAFFVLLLGIAPCCADDMPGPFNLLRLPAEFDNERITIRDNMPPGEETTVAELDGEGCLRHFWITNKGAKESSLETLALVLRVYCDGETTPSVETPLAPFFGIHHGHRAEEVNSPYLQVTDRGGYNSYFPMPYKKGIRMTIENQSPRAIGIWFQADFHEYPAGSLNEDLRFRAAYRRVNRAESYGLPYHVGHVRGSGVVVGLSLGMRVFDRQDRWYHCGGDLHLIDGGTSNARVLSGIGGEDFFGNAWGQSTALNGSIGTPYYEEEESTAAATERPTGGADQESDEPYLQFAAYRFFDKDPIAFRHSTSIDFGSLENDMSSVLYWYQRGAPERFVRTSSYEDRLPNARVEAGKYDVDPPGGLVWDVAGPFSAASDEQFHRAEFPEQRIDYNDTAPAEFGLYATKANRRNNGPLEARWTRGVRSRDGFVDLTPYFRPRVTRNAGLPVATSAYAATTIDSDSDTSREVLVGHDDALRLWVNGQLVHNHPGQYGFQTRTVSLPLKQGKNSVLVKAANQANTNFRAWVFMLSPAGQ